MQFSTTPTLEGQSIVEYCGVVTGEAILGANIFRDFFAGIRDRAVPFTGKSDGRDDKRRIPGGDGRAGRVFGGESAGCH